MDPGAVRRVGVCVYQEARRVVEQAAQAAAEVPLQEGRVLWRDGILVVAHYVAADLRVALVTWSDEETFIFRLLHEAIRCKRIKTSTADTQNHTGKCRLQQQRAMFLAPPLQVTWTGVITVKCGQTYWGRRRRLCLG